MRFFKFDAKDHLRTLKVVCWAIVEIDRKILLIQHGRRGGSGYGQWGFPYAHLHINESCFKSPLRGLRETTGLRGELDSLVCIFRLYKSEKAYDELHFVFVVRNPKGKMTIKEPKSLSIQTFDFHQIMQMPDASFVHAGVKEVLRLYRQGIRIPLDFIYEVGR